MRVRMLVERTGVDDGRTWPPCGEEADVPDELGAAVCAAGWAVPVAEERKTETPEAPLKPSEEQRVDPVAAPQDTAKTKTTAKPAKG